MGVGRGGWPSIRTDFSAQISGAYAGTDAPCIPLYTHTQRPPAGPRVSPWVSAVSRVGLTVCARVPMIRCLRMVIGDTDVVYTLFTHCTPTRSER